MKKWQTDESSNQMYDDARRLLTPVIESMFPSHELSVIGVNRDFMTDDILMTLRIQRIPCRMATYCHSLK